METLEYRKLLTLLDNCIEDAKRAADEKARREALEQHVKLIRHQIETVSARQAQIEKLGISVPVDVPAVLERLHAELGTLERQLQGEVGLPKTARMSEGDRALAQALYEEVMGVPVNQLELEERWTQFGIWSIRWRIIADRVGNDVVNGDGFLKMCFARIRERMQEFPEGFRFLPALDGERAGDWPGLLKIHEDKIAKLLEDRRRAEEAEQRLGDKAEEAIHALTLRVNEFRDLHDDPGERDLRHHVRNAAKFEHLREEVAEIVSEFRPILEKEFAFLWDGGDQAEEVLQAPNKLTNQDVLSRLCRRMFSKRLIGACHGPWDRIYKGFPEHDKGRAKDGLELLARAGILRKKSTLIGFRVSIEPKMVPVVEALAQGKPSGITAVDLWCLPPSGNGV